MYACRRYGLADQVRCDGGAGAVEYVEDCGRVGDGEAVDLDVSIGELVGAFRFGAEAAG